MALSRGAALLHDVIAGSLAFIFSIALRQDASVFLGELWDYAVASLAFGVLVGITGLLVGMNRGIWRYASLDDLVAIVKTATIAVGLFIVMHFVLVRLEGIPRSTVLISWSILIIFLSAPRALYRLYRNARDAKRQMRLQTSPVRRAIVVGANDNAEIFLKYAREHSAKLFEVVSIVDERERRVGRYMRDVRIDGGVADLPRIVDRLTQRGRKPDAVILARSFSDYDSHAKLEELIAVASELGLEVLRLPNLLDIRNAISEIDIQPIRLEDLLQRRPLTFDPRAVPGFIEGRKVLITGAGGSIGSELARQIAAMRPARLVLLDSSEFLLYSVEQELRAGWPDIEIEAILGNVRERENIARTFMARRPDVIFHAAALKHVPMVEQQPLEGLATNVLGTWHVAEAAVRAGAQAVVMVSTDKAVNPLSVLGASKRLAEMICQGLDVQAGETGTRFVTVRFGNVLGSAGSVIPLFEKQLRAGGPLTVTHPEIERYFMTIAEACMLILQATVHQTRDGANNGRIFVLDMGRPVKISDLARNVIRLAGRRPDVDIKLEFTGLRPGEKLFEELFDEAEMIGESGVPGLLVAAPRLIETDEALKVADEMARHVANGDLDAAIELLSANVPEFTVSEALGRQLRSAPKARLKSIARTAPTMIAAK
ncbi:polysaccharide biosynthesis protein [Aureimonas mangrovi]|uniref:polysaccharide biosynthesis protein n=1 Tax=Aureimonas mangrovi TaxID=2758041 RepID=UPI00163D7191|nr:nucleoside-diphosphate sugar epimerase/dehydratase [Aureimonas mangrovi]